MVPIKFGFAGFYYALFLKIAFYALIFLFLCMLVRMNKFIYMHFVPYTLFVFPSAWADDLTEKAKGKHHIGDFLPPEELENFLEKWDAVKEGRTPDLSDYKEHKITSENKGYQMLQKLGWSEGQGLGAKGGGIVEPVNK